MAIQYIVREYKDPLNPGSQGKYYARTVTRGLVGNRELAQRVAVRSGHSRGAIQGVVEDIFEAMCHFMSLGYNVQCGALGRFQLKLSSDKSETEKDISVSKIRKVYAHFQGVYSDYTPFVQFTQVVNLTPKTEEPEEPLP